MDSISMRLLDAISNSGKSYRELSHETGIAKSAIQRYATGETEKLPIDRVELLAKATGVTPQYLMGWDDDSFQMKQIERRAAFYGLSKSDFFASENGYSFSPPDLDYDLSPPEAKAIDKYRALDDYGRETVELVLDREYERCKEPKVIEIRPELYPELENVDVNVYDIPAAAGRGNYLEESGYEIMSFPRKKVPQNASFGVRIDGDSMEPRINDGSIVFVQECQKIEDGEIGIFYLDGKSYCKQLKLDHKRRKIILHSINPRHKNIVVDDDQNLRTFGRVVGMFNPSVRDDLVIAWKASKDGDVPRFVALTQKDVDEFDEAIEKYGNIDIDN